MTTLFVNACMRGEESRTLKLCQQYLDGIEDVVELDLNEMKLEPLTGEKATYRMQLQQAQDFDDEIFSLSKQFASADEIVIGAPYWDLSFPAALKTYIEHVSVCDIAFHYTEQGTAEGLCKAKMLTYITTAGGSLDGANFGYEYICAIAEMFGISETRIAAAENLDVVGIDIEANMDIARNIISGWKN